MSTLSHQRHRLILDLLFEQGSVRIRELSEMMKVSEMTLRRDLIELEERGFLRRIHGGAALKSDPDLGFGLRHKQHRNEKRQIAGVVAQMVKPGQSVYLDAGTTCVEIARALLQRNIQSPLEIQVITHGVNIAAELAGHTGIRVHQIGGEIYRHTFSATGPTAVDQIRGLYFDYFFMGACGAHLEAGWTNTSRAEVEVKQAALSRARATYVVADSSKWEQVSFVPIAPLGAVRGWVSDAQLPAKVVKNLTGLGLEVKLVGESSNSSKKR